MKKKLVFMMILVLILILTLPIATAFAADYETVVDSADVLSDEEENALREKIAYLEQNYNYYVTINTTEYLDGHYDIRDYSDEYAAIDTQTDGVVFVNDVYERDYYSSTRNLGRDIVTGAALDRITDVIVPYLQDYEYYNAYDAYLDEMDKFVSMYYSGEKYTGEPKTMGDYILYILIGVGVGFLIGLAVTAYMMGKMNTAVKQRAAHNYVADNSFNLTNRHDVFIGSDVVKTKISSESNSSGGSRGGGGGSY